MYMQRFTEKIVRLMKSENLFESQGGPIILSQVILIRSPALQFFFLGIYTLTMSDLYVWVYYLSIVNGLAGNTNFSEFLIFAD